MLFDDLLSTVSPPPEPVDNRGDWGQVVAQLGLALPVDYMQFVDAFGSGSLNDFIHVLNPFSTNKNLNFNTNLHTYWAHCANSKRHTLSGYGIRCFSSRQAYCHGADRQWVTSSDGSPRVSGSLALWFVRPPSRGKDRGLRCPNDPIARGTSVEQGGL